MTVSITVQDAPDYTGNVYIVGQLQDLTITGSVTVTSGDVNIVGPLTDTGYVAISIRESIQIDVNVTNSTLTITGDVTVSSGSVDISGPLTSEGNVSVAIQQSIQLDVNVTNSVINIQGSVDANITNATLTIEGDVNVTNSVLNVNVTNEVLQGKLAKPALMFGEDGDRVEAGSLIGANQSFTVIVWAKVLKFETYYGLASESVVGGRDWELRVETNGGIGVIVWDSGGHFYQGTFKAGFFTDGEFHMAGIAYDYDTKKIYVIADGELIDTGMTSPDLRDTGATFRIGWVYTAIHSLRGIVSRALAYNRVLDSSEVQALHSNPAQPIREGLILRYDFDEGSGTTVYDKSGNGNHGTIHGAVWVSEQGQVAPLLAVNIAAKQVTLDINVTAREVDLWVITRTGKAVSFQTIVGRNDYHLWEASAGGSDIITIATGRGRFKRFIGQIYTTSSSAYVNWRNINIAIKADGEDKFSAGGQSIGTIDELTGALTVHSVEGKAAGETWPPYRPGRAFRIVYVKHDDITDTYEPTGTTIGIFDLPFRMLAFEIEMDIEFEEKLEIEITNTTGFSPTSDVIMIGWVEWGEYL